tara:strand:- start:262 stop:795 length:534 start_codon:yes stop_codon:yes gene_type:complete
MINFVFNLDELRNWRKESDVWSEEEEQVIKDNYKSMSDPKMLLKFFPEKTKSQLKEKRLKLGCKRNEPWNRIWTKEEESLLLDNWLEYNQRELHEKFLPDKTPLQIRQKKMHMGLKKRAKWTDEEVSIIYEHGSNYSAPELSEHFLIGKSAEQIRHKRKQLKVIYKYGRSNKRRIKN